MQNRTESLHEFINSLLELLFCEAVRPSFPWEAQLDRETRVGGIKTNRG